MQTGIMIDATNAKECAVTKDRYKLNKYTFVKNVPFVDLVNTQAPYFHFQVLKPTDKEQREKALAYFNEHNKLYIAYKDRDDILLYLGCTTDIYIKSSMASDIDIDSINNTINEVAHWYRYYGKS